MEYFQKLDFFTKHNDSGVQRVQTNTGAIMTIFTILLSSFLFFVELIIWLRGEITNEMTVDTSLETTMQISFDITFPNLECRFIALDLVDQGGNRLLNIWKNVTKTDLDVDGNILKKGALKDKFSMEDYFGKSPLVEITKKMMPDSLACLPCYEATSEVDVCCNTCGDLIAAFQKTEMDFIKVLRYPQCRNLNVSSLFVDKNRGGCNVKGHLTANRVEGFLEIGLIRPFRVNATGPQELQHFFETHLNLTHHIRAFSFGLEHKGKLHPLSGRWTYQPYPPIFNYLIKIVPTTYISPPRRPVNTFQYAVTRYTRRFNYDSTQSPGTYFYYEFTPQRVVVRDTRYSFFHFLVRVCAVVGGVAALSKAIDSISFQVQVGKSKTMDLMAMTDKLEKKKTAQVVREPSAPQQPSAPPAFDANTGPF